MLHDPESYPWETRDAKPVYDASDECVIVPAAGLEKLEIPGKPKWVFQLSDVVNYS